MDFQTVSVIGLDYIGLPTSAILATHGVQVIGVVASAACAPSPGPNRPTDTSSPCPRLSKVGTTGQLCRWLAGARPDLRFPDTAGETADMLGINPWDVIEMANRHPRVKILQPGPGVGGHCIAAGPWFIVHSAPKQARLIRTAREINDAKPHQVVCKVKQRAGRFTAPVVACLGLAYKADIDELRESPAMEMVHALAEERVATLLVDHRQFKQVDRRLLMEKVVIDTRGLWR
jgi:UDP-N-acetyl-D-mannosaminuronic acid dehydrogenase